MPLGAIGSCLMVWDLLCRLNICKVVLGGGGCRRVTLPSLAGFFGLAPGRVSGRKEDWFLINVCLGNVGQFFQDWMGPGLQPHPDYDPVARR